MRNPFLPREPGLIAALAGSVAVFAIIGFTGSSQWARAQNAPAPRAAAKAAAVQPPAAAPAPTRTEITSFDAWSLTCGYGKDDQKIGCAASLRVTQKDSAKVVLVWNISKSNDGRVLSSIQTLPGVLVQKGVELKFGATASRVEPFTACSNTVCIATSEMDESFLKQASAATSVDASILGVDGKKYTYTFAPKGIYQVIRAVRG